MHCQNDCSCEKAAPVASQPLLKDPIYINTAQIQSDDHVRNTVHVIYSFFFSQPLRQPDRDNLLFFLEVGVYCNSTQVFYDFLVASDEPVVMSNTSEAKSLFAPMRQCSNVRVLWVPNGHYDLCNYDRFLEMDTTKSYRAARNVTHTFFINATVRGPFVPLYASPEPWYRPFVRKMSESDNTVLVGSYMNCGPYPHIQTMAFMLDNRGVDLAATHWKCPTHQELKWLVPWVIQNEPVRTRPFLMCRFCSLGSQLSVFTGPIQVYRRIKIHVSNDRIVNVVFRGQHNRSTLPRQHADRWQSFLVRLCARIAL